MTLDHALSLAACLGILVATALVALRRERNPLAPVLALYLGDLFIWNFATWAYKHSGHENWHWLDVTFSPMTPPLALHFVLIFAGRVRSMRRVLIAFYVGYGALSLSSASAFVFQEGKDWVMTQAWSIVYLVGLAAAIVVGMGVLGQHLRRVTDPDEQTRTRLLIISIVFAGTLSSTELWNDLFELPGLGHIGTLGWSVLMAILVLRFRLFGRELAASMLFYGILLALVAIATYLAVVSLAGGNTGLLIVGITTVTLALLLATRDFVLTSAQRRERMRRLAGLGRVAAQMAHDIKNPLAAVRLATQVLEVDLEQDGLPDKYKDMLALIVSQVDRVNAVIDRYQRLSEVTPERETVDVPEVIDAVLERALPADPEDPVRVELRTSYAEELPPCQVDRALLASAVENVVHNAIEALETDGGTVEVRVSTTHGGARGPLLAVAVSDDGPGMDPRQARLAIEDFHTTKAEGSGLGLAFVRRVAEAHGGHLMIDSARGSGTTVTLELPIIEPEAAGQPQERVDVL